MFQLQKKKPLVSEVLTASKQKYSLNASCSSLRQIVVYRQFSGKIPPQTKQLSTHLKFTFLCHSQWESFAKKMLLQSSKNV